MLALDDEALARLCLACTAVAPDDRAALLTKFAQAADPSPPPTPNAIYSKRTRERTANGEREFRLTLNVVAIEEMLRADNLLPADPTHEQTAQALAEFVTRLATYSAA